MILSRVEVAALVSLTILAMASPAISKDGNRHSGRGHQPRQEQSIVGTGGLPSVVPGIGTFVGSISAVRIKGNGVFIAVDRGSRSTAVAYRAPKARIIEVAAENTDDACSLEAGVCVIRLKN